MANPSESPNSGSTNPAAQLSLIETLPKLLRQAEGKITNEKRPVFRPLLTLLLFLNNHPPDIPICLNHGEVYGTVCIGTGGAEYSCNRLIEFAPHRGANFR